MKPKQDQKTDNGVDAKGASRLSEALKVNTTLVILDLGCEQQQQNKTQQAHCGYEQEKEQTT